MKIIASHVTAGRNVMGMANRMRTGGQALLNLPIDQTQGGCFWGLVQSIQGAGGQDLVDGFNDRIPHVGRAPDQAHALTVEIDVPTGDYQNFDTNMLADIQANLLLGNSPLNGVAQPRYTIPGELTFQQFETRSMPVTPAIWGPIDANINNLANDIATWLKRPGRAVANLPASVTALGLTGGSRNRIFQLPNLRTAENSVWETVGRMCNQYGRIGMVIIPRGSYVTRTGGGRFVLVPNNQVQARVKVREQSVPWL